MCISTKKRIYYIIYYLSYYSFFLLPYFIIILEVANDFNLSAVWPVSF